MHGAHGDGKDYISESGLKKHLLKAGDKVHPELYERVNAAIASDPEHLMVALASFVDVGTRDRRTNQFVPEGEDPPSPTAAVAPVVRRTRRRSAPQAPRVPSGASPVAPSSPVTSSRPHRDAAVAGVARASGACEEGSDGEWEEGIDEEEDVEYDPEDVFFW